MSRSAAGESIRRRFIAQWQWRRLADLLSRQFVLGIALCALLIAVCEADLGTVAQQDIFAPGYIPPLGYGLSVPGEGSSIVIGRHGEELARFAPDNVIGLSWSEQHNAKAVLSSLKYTHSYAVEAGTLVLYKEIGTASWWAFCIWAVSGGVQAIGWLFGFGEASKKANKLLRPLESLGDTPAPVYESVPAPPPPSQTPGSALKLGELADVIRNINVGKLDTRIDVAGCPHELRGLALSINGMLERIDEAYRLQAQFVSDASHELRTPISVIKGYSELLDRWGKDDPAALQESITAIRTEADRMNALVQQLLFLARGGRDALELAFENVDASALMEELWRECKLVDPGHAWTLKPGGRVIVRADPALLKQAMRILTDNAMKYTPEGEAIALAAHPAAQGMARLEVRDNGIGIAEADLPHIFDRFYRSDASRDKKSGGAGLGLSIAKWIVDKHGGFIELLSRPGVGTSVTVRMPEGDAGGSEAPRGTAE